MQLCTLIPWTTGLLCAVSSSAAAFESQPALIESQGVTLYGEWLLPAGQTTAPCVVIVGGTMSHTRDGAMPGAGSAGASRDALRRLAIHLAAAGCISLRWDKRGHGQTPSGPQPVTNELEAADVAAAISLARAQPRTGHVIVAGESAGGYFACMAARDGAEADGYIFLGCLASPSLELFRYNYGRLKEWAERSDANRQWAEQHALRSLAVGHAYADMFAAARSGAPYYVIRYREHTFHWPLARISTEIAHPPAELFRHIRKPAFVLQGAADMNVPAGDAETIRRIISEAGNPDVRMVMIPGADHSFQYASDDPDQRMRDRHGFASFYRLYCPSLYTEIAAWLRDRFPGADATVRMPELPRPGIIAWNGIQVTDDVTDPVTCPGVDTLEGRIGPLMKAEGCQVHFIDMPPGLYLHEHPHATESIIYTVRGRWVLCSGQRRHLMKPGTLFWFARNEPTGYEVPFEDPAYILIFKGDRSGWTDARFWEYLQDLARRLRDEQAGGEPFRLRDLPPDHPARQFARRVNPDWERTLPSSGPAP